MERNVTLESIPTQTNLCSVSSVTLTATLQRNVELLTSFAKDVLNQVIVLKTAQTTSQSAATVENHMKLGLETAQDTREKPI